MKSRLLVNSKLFQFCDITRSVTMEMNSRGRILVDRFGPGVGHLNYLAVPGVGIFEFLFLPVTTNHFPGWGISVILTSHFCAGVGNFTPIFWKRSKSRPMTRLSPPPHPLYRRRLDIDRCIISIAYLWFYFDDKMGKLNFISLY